MIPPLAPPRPIDEAVLDEIAARARAAGSRPVVLIDGGSGAGKSSLAERLVPRLGDASGDAQLVSLDAIFPGWDGLAAGSAAVHDTLLRPEAPGWRRWDWGSGAFAEWRSVDPDRPLVIEGCGALSRANRARADLAVWIELDAAERRRRALARDGETFRPHWARWAAQEADFRAAEPPSELADVVLDGR